VLAFSTKTTAGGTIIDARLGICVGAKVKLMFKVEVY